jgi:DNA-binding transcriptional MerR regulator
MHSEYTLNELSKISGEPVRRIRSYIQQGLLPRPLSAGRNATYPERSLDRLRAIKNLRSLQGLSVDEVRTVIANLDDKEIAELAAESDKQVNIERDSQRRPSNRELKGRSRAGEALRYIQRLRRGDTEEATLETNELRTRLGRTDMRESSLSFEPDNSTVYKSELLSNRISESPDLRDTKSQTSIRKLVARLDELMPSDRIRRRAKSEEWMKVPITPDMELHVRKEYGDYDMAAIELLADYIREALSGGI